MIAAEALAFLLLIAGWVVGQILLARKLGLVRLAESVVITDPRQTPTRSQKIASKLLGVMLLSVPLHVVMLMLLVVAAALR